MKGTPVCPAKCAGNESTSVQRVTREALGISPLMARAAKLRDQDELFTCLNCRRVWRRTFDVYLIQFRNEILGEYRGSYAAFEFQPKAWLLRAVEDLKFRSGEQPEPLRKGTGITLLGK